MSGEPGLHVRWSEHEAGKPYARPFAVSFLAAGGASAGGVAVSGADLLYYIQFQRAVLSLAGELFRHPGVEAAGDPQRAWLDVLAALLPSLDEVTLVPRSEFSHEEGRAFHFRLGGDRWPWARLPPLTLLEYQDLQAALAHQTGRLFRRPDLEVIEDPGERRRAWMGALGAMLDRPGPEDAISDSWPWR